MGTFVALYSVLAFLVPVVVVGAIVYLIFRRRNGQGGITAYHALIAYFYAVTAASIFIGAVGLAYLLNVAFAEFYDGVELLGNTTTGFALLAIGALLLLLHWWGRKVMEDRHDTGTRTVKRVYLFSMLALSSISGLVSMPLALVTGARYSLGDRYYVDTPNTYLAVALVVVLVWSYYFWRVAKELRADRS
ncbi:MAG: hypothetical protein A2133_10080 [Actinobacteria bacterium RBG_16_64_13]|nr:MAG: hypothetical protein A2133_10080 [Actinobacteria bacterium RBG_16_64_13]